MPFAHHTRFYLAFNLVLGVGPIRLARLVEQCGSVEAAWAATPTAMMAAGLDARSTKALRTAQRTLDLDKELDRVVRAGVDLLTLEDDTYPALLRQIPAPPPLIYVRGTLSNTDDWAMAIVGTRSPTSYGKEATYRLAYDLASNSVTIVSGLALGIDGVAHRAALEAGGRTIAVLACGVDTPYPSRHRRLADEILEQGAIVSEYGLGVKPMPLNFPPRNRVISGLALGTLVTEAGARSGALITVDFALEQGRDVFALPGTIFSRASAGVHQLIRNGAELVTSAEDILLALDMDTRTVQHEARMELPGDPVEAAVLELLSHEPQHIDALSRACTMSAAHVSAALTMLELKGYVRQAGAMQYVLMR